MKTEAPNYFTSPTQFYTCSLLRFSTDYKYVVKIRIAWADKWSVYSIFALQKDQRNKPCNDHTDE